jgi:hypothetical protein
MFPIVLSSKRARLALRFFTYGVMTLATVLLTVLAIFYAMGYRFNQNTLTFEQGGLLQLRSVPESASVTVDGRMQSFATPGRVNLPAGVHTVGMQRDGYRSWQKTVSLAPGQLLWLNYTRLIPNSVTTQPVKEFVGMNKVVPSPDRRWLLVHEKADQPVMTLVDVADERKPVSSTLTIPDAQLTRVNNALGRLEPTEWELGSRYFLVRHRNGPTDEWLRVDRVQPEETVNLTRLFRLNISNAHFAGSTPNNIYAKTDNVLRRFDIAAGSASAALVNDLQQFVVYGDDTIAFVAEREQTVGAAIGKQQVVGLYRRGQDVAVQTFPMGVSLKLAYGEYTNHSYLAIHHGQGDIQILRDPSVAATKGTAQFANLHVGKAVSQLKFSNNGRMIMSRAGNILTTYDLEVGTTHSTALPFMDQEPKRGLLWLDDYYLWTDAGDRLRIVEFDGQNDREIAAVASGFGVSLSQSGETLFSIGKDKASGAYVLQASQLVVR